MPGPAASVTKICMPAIMRFSAPFIGRRPTRTGGVLPEQDVVLEEDRHAADVDGQHRHQLAIEVIGHAAEGLVVGLGRQQGRHVVGHCSALRMRLTLGRAWPVGAIAILLADGRQLLRRKSRSAKCPDQAMRRCRSCDEALRLSALPSRALKRRSWPRDAAAGIGEERAAGAVSSKS